MHLQFSARGLKETAYDVDASEIKATITPAQ